MSNLLHHQPGPGRHRCLAGVLLLVLGTIVGGCGGGAHPATTTAAAGQAPVTAEQSPTTKAVARPTPRIHPRTPFVAAGPVIKSFTGTGSRGIGSLKEKRAIVLQWNTAAPAVQVFTAQGFVLVASHAPEGRVRLPRGDYLGLRIAAPGRWTIRLRAAP